MNFIHKQQIILGGLIAFAAFCNSVMDTQNSHWSTSIFARFKGFWKQWFAYDSALNKYVNRDVKQGRKKLFWIINYPVQLTDGWHFFKMLMIFAFCAAISHTWVEWVVYGLIWNITFDLFYDKLLRK